MTACKHANLILLTEKKRRVRCRTCHLVISADDLTDRYCPECYETMGARNFDFEEIREAEPETGRYRCEDCGIIIESR